MLDIGNSIEKSSYKRKWLIEILLIFTISGLYYNFDAPLALHEELKAYFKDDPEVGPNFVIYYNRLYGAIAWPNIFMPFLIGYFSDKYGNRTLLLIITFCGLAGQLMMWIGCLNKSIWTMIAGRGVAGIGIGTIFSLGSKFITPYFKGKSLSFILSLNVSIGCLFEAINILIAPLISRSSSINMAFFIQFLFCGVSVVAQIFCNILDIQADQHAYRRSMDLSQENVSKLEFIDKISFLEKLKRISFAFKMVALYLFLYFSAYLCYLGNFIPLSISILYGNLGDNPISHDQAHQIERYAFFALLLSVCILPILGHLIDKLGGHIEVALISTLFCSLSLFLCYHIHPLILALIFEFGFSIIQSSMWSCIPYLVSPQLLGMCYGIANSLRFLGLTILTIFTGIIAQNDKDEPQQYKNVAIMYGTLIATGFPIILIFRSICIKHNLLNYDKYGNQTVKLFNKSNLNPSNISVMSSEK